MALNGCENSKNKHKVNYYWITNSKTGFCDVTFLKAMLKASTE